MAIVIALTIGIPPASSPPSARDTVWDYAANIVALWGLSTPNFWLGIMLILFFSVTLGWLPASGYVSPFEDLTANLASMIMPAFVLGNAIAAVLMRHTRSAMLQVLKSDYVRTARAKGLDERVVVLKHALRNALIPVITLGALEFGTLLSGAVLTEQVFTIPGFGKLIVDAVFNRDYAVVQGVVLFTATAYIVLNLLADMAYFVGQSAACAAEAMATIAVDRSDRRPRADAAAQRVLRRLHAPPRRAGRTGGRRVLRPARAVRAVDRAARSARRRAGARCARRRARRTGSAPTRSAATSLSRVIWGARASLLAGVVSVLHRARRSACPSACSPATPAAGSTR